MKLVYLAHAIDQAAKASSHWTSTVTEELAVQPEVALYRPSQAWAIRGAPRVDPRIERVNRAALENCDALVAIVERGVPTIGTAREIEFFAAAGKPWAVLTDVTNSFSLADAPLNVPNTVDGLSKVIDWLETLPIGVVGRTRQPIRFAKASGLDGRMPTRAHDGDAGFDLYVAEKTFIPYGSFKDVPCGVRVALPDGVWGRIVGRSSTLRKRSLLVAEGILDSGYRGPLFAGVWNQGQEGTTVDVGERIAQLILAPNISPSYHPEWASATQFAAIPHDGRGDAGFGSSGA